MKRILTTAFLVAAACGASAAEPAAPHPGKTVFDRWCAECHAPGHGHPGTQQLGWTRGEKFAVLEQRGDLVADYVKLVVRRGLIEMPPYRPTEIPDAQLQQLADYLAPSKARPKK